jgi:integrase
MAEIFRRVWRSGARKAKRVAFGYTIQVPCRPCPHRGKHGQVVHPDGIRQERVTNAAWTEEDAEKALAARLLEAPAPPSVDKTLEEVAQEYLDFKRGKGKRSIAQDEQILKKLKRGLGAETLITEITAQRIAQYDRDRVTATSRRGQPVSPSTVNRELAILRHLLRLAEEWGYIAKVPRIRLAKEPEGRVVWLEAPEEEALIKACKASQTKHLAAIVTVALETGMRHGEIMSLTWDRVDRARGVLMLERTKSGKRREVPMRPAVDAVFAGLPEPREGRVWPDKSIRKAFENAVEAAGLKDFTFHGCRHHFASWFMMRGGQLESLRQILGHKDITMTLRYMHLSPGHLRAEMNKTATGAGDKDDPTPDSTKSAQGAKMSPERLVSGHAPVAQLDRATVS